MSQTSQETITFLPTGVPGLDEVLGGGIPQYSFDLIAGASGTGKTTLVHQIVFANAAPDRPALYFSVMGESPIKMLRYQGRFAFFDPSKVGSAVRFVSLSEQVISDGPEGLLATVLQKVQETNPALVVVDSFRGIVRAATTGSRTGRMDPQEFLLRLSVSLMAWQATTFLIADYVEPTQMADDPAFTIADGILWLFQSIQRNSVLRKLQVVKMRGLAPSPGLHTFRITLSGITVFPRIPMREERPGLGPERPKISIGVPGLDEMLGGGIPAGDSVLLAGPPGVGKSVISTQFITEGVGHGEPGIIVAFEEYPQEYMARAKMLGCDLEEMARRGQARVLYVRPLDLTVDESLRVISEASEQVKARRVVIDSLSAFEMAVTQTVREDFRESLYRLLSVLTGRGITVLVTLVLGQTTGDLGLTADIPYFMADDIILLRWVELRGRLRRMIAVPKVRSSLHSDELRVCEVTSHGLVVGDTLEGYEGLLTGVPHTTGRARR